MISANIFQIWWKSGRYEKYAREFKPIRNVEIFITSGTEPLTNNVAKTMGVCVYRALFFLLIFISLKEKWWYAGKKTRLYSEPVPNEKTSSSLSPSPSPPSWSWSQLLLSSSSSSSSSSPSSSSSSSSTSSSSSSSSSSTTTTISLSFYYSFTGTLFPVDNAIGLQNNFPVDGNLYGGESFILLVNKGVLMHAPCLLWKLSALHIYLFPACGDVTFVWKKPWNASYVNNTQFVNDTKDKLKTALVSMLINFSFLFMCFFLVLFLLFIIASDQAIETTFSMHF